MKSIHENRTARAARAIAARLENTPEVRLSISSPRADHKVFIIMAYMSRYCGKYWIEYLDNNTAIVRKQG